MGLQQPLTQPYYGTGKWDVADSRFGSIKCASELMKRGLYSLMLVKTAHNNFPKELLGETPLERGEWVTFSTIKNDAKLQACRFKDLKTKYFISTCSSIVPENPHWTKHSGVTPHPKVTEKFLKYAASIDFHNHYRCGSAGLEDVWCTHNPHLYQFSGVLGFCFTYAYVAMKYFTKCDTAHHEFKCAAALALKSFNTCVSFHETRSINMSSNIVLHTLEKIEFSKECYYFQHGYEKPKKVKNTVSFRCEACWVPICKPTKSECWDLHIMRELPRKLYLRK